MSEATKRRGKGKKRALVHVALRIPPEVYDFYRMANPIYTSTMREVLTEYAEKQNPSLSGDHQEPNDH
jgi:hypothetical protein